MHAALPLASPAHNNISSPIYVFALMYMRAYLFSPERGGELKLLLVSEGRENKDRESSWQAARNWEPAM